jgi:hypothetical protein
VRVLSPEVDDGYLVVGHGENYMIWRSRDLVIW